MNMRDLAAAYVVPPDIDDRLRNWARWARVRGWQSSCGSAEKNYQPDAGNVMEGVAPIERADLWDALEIERTWSAKMPMKEKIVLKAVYIGPQGRSSDDAKRRERLLARQIGCHRQDFPRMVYMAAMMMKNLAKPPHLVRSAA